MCCVLLAANFIVWVSIHPSFVLSALVGDKEIVTVGMIGTFPGVSNSRKSSGLGTLDSVTIFVEVLIMPSFESIQPLYTVYYYTDFLYRIVKFKRSSLGFAVRDQKEEPEGRFSQSYSRSRSMVLQYALCNHWDYFITITVSPENFDRYDLDGIYRQLYVFFRLYGQAHGKISYLLVPECHKDGAWHFHGFVSGVLPSSLSQFVPGIHPQKLIDAGYLNWGALAAFIGYVSLSPVKNPVGAGFYLVKYITKEHAHDAFYQHLYYHSQGLKTACPVSDCYSHNSYLDSFLTCESDFCSSGWVKLNKPDFTFPFMRDCEIRYEEELTPVDLESLDVADQASEDGVSEKFSFVQLSLDDWQSGGMV